MVAQIVIAGFKFKKIGVSSRRVGIRNKRHSLKKGGTILGWCAIGADNDGMRKGNEVEGGFTNGTRLAVSGLENEGRSDSPATKS